MFSALKEEKLCKNSDLAETFLTYECYEYLIKLCALLLSQSAK